MKMGDRFGGQLLAQLWVLSAAHSLGIWDGAWSLELPRGHLALGAAWFYASYGF